MRKRLGAGVLKEVWWRGIKPNYLGDISQTRQLSPASANKRLQLLTSGRHINKHQTHIRSFLIVWSVHIALWYVVFRSLLCVLYIWYGLVCTFLLLSGPFVFYIFTAFHKLCGGVYSSRVKGKSVGTHTLWTSQKMQTNNWPSQFAST